MKGRQQKRTDAIDIAFPIMVRNVFLDRTFPPNASFIMDCSSCTLDSGTFASIESSCIVSSISNPNHVVG